MPRTSKKKNTVVKPAADSAPEKIYSVGIYARLSVDEEKAGEHSNCGQARKNESIETEKGLRRHFPGSGKIRR